MGSDRPPDTPSSPEPRPPKSPPPTSPDPSPAPDRPQIGIIHLLVWTACVAVYLGLERAVGQMTVDPSSPFGGTYSAIASVLESIGYGAALGGLVLCATRRWRGLAFPKHPGEYLLVVIALGQVLRFLYAFLACPVTFERLPLIWTFLWARLVLDCLVLLWPVLAVKKRRWRSFFGTLLAFDILFIVYFATSQPQLILRAPAVFSALLLGCLLLDMAADAILIVIVLKDRHQRLRYPWTHWLGVAARLWVGLINAPTGVEFICEEVRFIFLG